MDITVALIAHMRYYSTTAPNQGLPLLSILQQQPPANA